jgi:hypothetical protein
LPRPRGRLAGAYGVVPSIEQQCATETVCNAVLCPRVAANALQRILGSEQHGESFGPKAETPAKKQRAIDDRRSINAVCLKYRQFGVPKNIRHFKEWLSQHGALTRTNKWGKQFDVGETIVRDILHNTFGVK